MPVYPHRGRVPQGLRKLELLDSPLFPDCDPGTAGGCASYVGTTPLLFRDILPRWVLWARLTARLGPLRSDMTFRQNAHYSNGFWRNRGNLVLLLMLRYDVTRGITPNGFQQIIMCCPGGAKGLRVFAQRPVNSGRGQTWVKGGLSRGLPDRGLTPACPELNN